MDDPHGILNADLDSDGEIPLAVPGWWTISVARGQSNFNTPDAGGEFSLYSYGYDSDLDSANQATANFFDTSPPGGGTGYFGTGFTFHASQEQVDATVVVGASVQSYASTGYCDVAQYSVRFAVL